MIEAWTEEAEAPEVHFAWDGMGRDGTGRDRTVRDGTGRDGHYATHQSYGRHNTQMTL